MRFTRRNTFWGRLPRRLGICAAAVAYLVATVGFPVPAVTLRASDNPAPTSDHPCCCPREAHRHGSCCCFKPQLPACCRNEQPAGKPAAEPPDAGAVRWVGGPSALGCRGLSMAWIASGAVAPPPAALARLPHAAPAELVPSLTESPFCLSLSPPDPPPRPAAS